MSTVGILLGLGYQLGAHGIEVNIADQRQQVAVFLAYDGFITTLKQVADLLVCTIKVLCVRLLVPFT